ncbi:carbohydrate ABC transporter permease [Kribbella albertanoniae]|uniref:Carbohydrate ABC transporter permease n=1 Tax=Kribbella albertanoniae TaxID=1266829 RepID=A0A4R4Q8A2_9ACTN|nr:carbohydrate ABC transporter permease [Kribbella albertanoniae]TDC31410.1 carbohydrate ABC transporter permease [Kribbella albertanoniae]
MRTQRWTPRSVLLVAVLLAVSFIYLYPFLWPVFSSFKSSNEMYTAGFKLWPEHWTTENYSRAWTTANFSRYLFNSVFYSTASTAITVISAALAGYTLARYRFPGSRLIGMMILAFLFMPTATSVLPVFELIQTIGLLNTVWGVLLALTGGVGFSTLLFRGYFSAIPQELFDAAAIDGAGFFRTFRLIFPLAKPIIATTAILGFTSSWQEYFVPLIFTLGDPNLRTVSVGLRAFTQQYSVDLSGFAAAVTLSMLPIVAVFLFFQRYFIEGLAGALKD